MIKLKYLFTILILFFSANFLICQNATTKVTFYKALKNLTDKTNSPPKQLKGINFSLIFNQEESLFYLEDELNSDISPNNERFIHYGGGDGKFYCNINDAYDLHQTEFSGKFFLIQKKREKYNWSITKESKKINDYTCYKALTELKVKNEITKKEITQKIEVWFSPEISFPFGPSGYDGLPGLVLEVKVGGVYFIANKIEFNDESKIEKPTKGKEIKEDEFEKLVAKVFRDNFKR